MRLGDGNGCVTPTGFIRHAHNDTHPLDHSELGSFSDTDDLQETSEIVTTSHFPSVMCQSMLVVTKSALWTTDEPSQESHKSCREPCVPRLFLQVGVAIQAHRSFVRGNRLAVQLGFRPGGSFKVVIPINASHQHCGLPDRT